MGAAFSTTLKFDRSMGGIAAVQPCIMSEFHYAMPFKVFLQHRELQEIIIRYCGIWSIEVRVSVIWWAALWDKMNVFWMWTHNITNSLKECPYYCLQSWHLKYQDLILCIWSMRIYVLYVCISVYTYIYAYVRMCMCACARVCLSQCLCLSLCVIIHRPNSRTGLFQLLYSRLRFSDDGIDFLLLLLAAARGFT